MNQHQDEMNLHFPTKDQMDKLISLCTAIPEQSSPIFLFRDLLSLLAYCLLAKYNCGKPYGGKHTPKHPLY